jgi:hypothetical protein
MIMAVGSPSAKKLQNKKPTPASGLVSRKPDMPQSNATLPIPAKPESETKRAGGKRHRKRQV